MMTGSAESRNPGARPGRTSPDDAMGQLDRLAGLVRQLGGLLDGSLKRVSLAQETLAKSGLVFANATAAEAGRLLAHAAGDLERMAELLHAALQGASQPLGSPTLARARPVTLGEAVEHAATVLGPLASQQHATITRRLEEGVDALPAGSLYTVVLNGLQNAVEAAGRAGGGTVVVSVSRSAPPENAFGRDARQWLLLEITDDGAGPPPMPERSRVFDLGYTTKPNGSGLGLAVARSVVRSMNGTIELAPGEAGEPSRRGAVLRVRFPSAAPAQDARLGGAA